MSSRDSRVDRYIADSAEFARPILSHLRELAHAACPQVEETIKWKFPHFTYHGILFSMGAFKEHCALNFWKGAQVVGETGATEQAMGQFGRITSLADLPPDEVLAEYIRRAVELNLAGEKAPARPKPAAKPEPGVPDYLLAALEANPAARDAFQSFSPNQRREYVEWLTGAKGEDTRQRRLATAVEWIAEGKPRHWKYMKR